MNSNPVMPAPIARKCKVCDAGIAEDRRFKAREMYFGTRESFTYLECANCGSLQIEEVPPDLSRFYPANYYTQAAPAIGRETLAQALRYFLRGQLTVHQLGHSNFLGRLISSLHQPKNPLPVWLDPRYLRVTLDSRILDVGCGNGALLAHLRRFGFRRLEGVEPFTQAGLDNGPIRIHRTALANFAGGGQYDLIMLHHVFEHLPDPAAALAQLVTLLAPDGRLLIRIPVAGSDAWRRYGPDWVSLDAPRHLVICSQGGLRQLAERQGLELCGTYCDSSSFQFWASEQYHRDIPLEDPRGVGRERECGPFTRQELDEFARQSEEADRNQAGDQAVFYFKLRQPAGRETESK
jgi:SAM-dependent methyltransferase